MGVQGGLSVCFSCGIKTSERSKLREALFGVTRLLSILSWKSKLQELKASGHIASTIKDQRVMNSLFTQSRIPSQGMVPHIVSSTSLIKIISVSHSQRLTLVCSVPHGCAQRFVSQVTLVSAILVLNVNNILKNDHLKIQTILRVCQVKRSGGPDGFGSQALICQALLQPQR